MSTSVNILVGKKIRVFFVNEQDWFEGVIGDYHPQKGYFIQYFDGDNQWLKSMHNSNVQLLQDDSTIIQNVIKGNDDFASPFKDLHDDNDDDENELKVIRPNNPLISKNNIAVLSNHHTAIKSSEKRIISPRDDSKFNSPNLSYEDNRISPRPTNDKRFLDVSPRFDKSYKSEPEKSPDQQSRISSVLTPRNGVYSKGGTISISPIYDDVEPSINFSINPITTLNTNNKNITKAATNNISIDKYSEESNSISKSININTRYDVKFNDNNSNTNYNNNKKYSEHSSNIPPDYQSHQEYNHHSICSEVHSLPDRGVLLVGSVLGAAGLFSDAFESELDGDLFFKVVFIEGGTQPAMFRCKTPIFTSESINTSRNPKWDKGRFHFDMIMPISAMNDKNLEYGFSIQGEISIIIYQTRRSGGNNMIGQVTFDLADMVKTGTVEFFQSGYEGRSITGANILSMRAGGGISGEIDIQLNIAWKSMKNDDKQIITSKSNNSLPLRSVSASSKVRTTEDNTQAKLTTTTKRPSSAVNNTNTPVKIVSKLQRKQREDAMRINRENLKLQKMLGQFGNKTGLYGENGGTTNIMIAEPKAINDTKSIAIKSNSNSTQNNNQSYDQLLRLYTDLKKKNGLDNLDNDRLRSKVNKLKQNVKQGEISINKIKESSNYSQRESQTKGMMMLNTSRSNKSDTKNDNKIDYESNFMKNNNVLNINNSKEFKKSLDTTYNNTIPNPVVVPLSNEELIAMNINDNEYRSLSEEYHVLQNVRRGLLDRIQLAKKAYQKADGIQSTVNDRTTLLQRRLLYLEDIAGDIVIDIIMSLIQDNSNYNEKKELKDQKSTNQSINNNNIVCNKDSDDYILFDRLRSIKQDYNISETMYNSNIHLLNYESSIIELSEIAKYLHEKCNINQAYANKLRTEIDEDQELLHKIINKKYINKLRENISNMKLRFKSLQLKSKLKLVDEEQHTIDVELSRFRYRQTKLLDDQSDIQLKESFYNIKPEESIDNISINNNNYSNIDNDNGTNNNDKISGDVTPSIKKKVKKHINSSARFSDTVISDVHYVDNSNHNDKNDLFYNIKDEEQFKIDYDQDNNN